MLRDRIFPIAKEEKNLVEVGGGTLVYRVRIRKNGAKIGNIKAYGVKMYISRYEQSSCVKRLRNRKRTADIH